MTNAEINESKRYNGWTNYETWLCNLWHDDAFTEDAQRIWDEIAGEGPDEVTVDCAVDELAEYIEEVVRDGMPDTGEHGFACDLITAAMQEVDFHEIAKHYIDEVEREAPEAE